jgi:transposase
VFPRPDLSRLTEAEKDALILALFDRLEAMEREITALKAQLGDPPKTPDNSSLPPSKGQKPNRTDKTRRDGPRQGSLGRKGGGRPLSCTPDETVIARPTCCMHCHAPFLDGDHVLHGRYDKVDLPPVRPVVTRVERYRGRCRCCGGTTLAPVPEGLEPGSPFSLNILALAIYLRFTHAISYKRLTQLFLHLFALEISEGALDAMFRRAVPCFDNEVAAILARLRRARVVCSDETTVRIDGVTHWNWVFQNEQVVIHVIRNSRGAGVVSEVLAGHKPKLWVSDLYGAQQGHAELWQVCLAHQLRECQFAIDAGDTVFAPRMKALLLRAAVLARRSKSLAQSTRRYHLRRLNAELTRIMALAPDNQHGKRLRKRYHKVRNHLFTFLDHPEVPPDNNGSERELRPTATYRKVTGGFRSNWGAALFAGVRSVIGTAARSGTDAYQAIKAVLRAGSVLQAG